MEQWIKSGSVSGRAIGNKIPKVYVPTANHRMDEIIENGRLSVIRSGRIGDMVMLEPVIRQLSSVVTTELITKPAYQFMFSCPVVSSPSEGYYVVNLESYAEEHFLTAIEHRTDIFASAFGVSLEDHSNQIPVDSETLQDVKYVLGDMVSERFIVAAPRSVSVHRTWDGIGEVLDFIGKQFSVVEVDSEYWKIANQKIDPLSINHLYSLISLASLVVSPDTGVMHLAGALGIPFVGIWTGKEKMSSNPFTRCKYYRDYIVIEEPSVHKVRKEVLNAMSGNINGRELVTKIDQVVHDGPRVYRFSAGVPVWVPEDYAQRLINTGEFRAIESKTIPKSQLGNRIVWIMGSSNYGGAENHTLSLMRYFKKLGFTNCVVLVYNWSGNLIKDLHSVCDTVVFSSRSDASTLSADVTRCNPDIVIQVTAGETAKFRMLWGNIPHVFVAHGSYEMFPYHDNTHYIYTSDAASENNKKAGVVIQNGVDIPFWESGKYIRSRLGLDAGDFVVAYSGRLSPEKNIPLLLKACARMGFKLIIVGTGVEQQTLDSLVEELGIKDRVKFTGYVAQSGIRNVLKSVNLLVLPSNTESMPLCILEAMAAGCPVVATNVGDVAKVLDNGNNGLVIEPKNLEQLCSAIQYVIDDPLSTEIRANNARLAVAANHDLSEMCRTYARVVGDIMGIPLVTAIVIDRSGNNLHDTINSVVGTYSNLDIVVLTNNPDTQVRYSNSSVQVLNVDVTSYALSSLIVASREYIHGKYCLFVESGDLLESGWIRKMVGEISGDAVLSGWRYGGDHYSGDFMEINSIDKLNATRCPLSTMFMSTEALDGFNITDKDMSASLELRHHLSMLNFVCTDDISTVCVNDPKYSYANQAIIDGEMYSVDDSYVDGELSNIESLEDIDDILGETNV